MTEFGVVTQVSEKHISRGSATSIYSVDVADPWKYGRRYGPPKFFGDPYLRQKRFDLERLNWYNMLGSSVTACFFRALATPVPRGRVPASRKFWDLHAQLRTHYEKQQPNFAW